MQCRGIMLRRCQRRHLVIKKTSPGLGARHGRRSTGKQCLALVFCQPLRLSITLGAGLMGISQRVQMLQLFRLPARLREDLMHPRFDGREDLELLIRVVRGG